MNTNYVMGTVIAVSKQWWIKVNNKAFRSGPLDGATFPHIIKVKYYVNNTEYIIRKWLSASEKAPELGALVKLEYENDKPSKVKLV